MAEIVIGTKDTMFPTIWEAGYCKKYKHQTRGGVWAEMVDTATEIGEEPKGRWVGADVEPDSQKRQTPGF